MTDAAYSQTWAQLRDAEQALRALAGGQVREYVAVLERLAHTLAPAAADAAKRAEPAYFKRLTAAEWWAFFAAMPGGQPLPIHAGWGARIDDSAAAGAEPQELARLRGELTIVQAENHRLRELLQAARKEQAALAAALKEKGSRPVVAGKRAVPDQSGAEALPDPASLPNRDAAPFTLEGLPAQVIRQHARGDGRTPAQAHRRRRRPAPPPLCLLTTHGVVSQVGGGCAGWVHLSCTSTSA